MDREQILAEIRRCAAENGGKAVGRRAFLRETGIKENWVDRNWLRWSDAVAEAGFSPNSMTLPYSDDSLLETLANLTRELGHYPVRNELLHRLANTPGSPDRKTFDKLGGKATAMRSLARFCTERPEFADVLLLLGDLPPHDDVAPTRAGAMTGYVYLVKSGKHYKIGQTNDLVRRTGEIRIQLPQRMELVHQISTDDPIGIERYWHQRFDHLRTNGEWFALSAAEVAIFRRRRFMQSIVRQGFTDYRLPVTTLEDRDRTRTVFLLALYEDTDGDTMADVNFRTIGERIGLGEQEAAQVMRWLTDRHLVEGVALGGSIGITARGVDEAERMIREGGVVPQSVLILSVDEQRAVEAFLTQYRSAEASGDLPLAGDAYLEADAEVRTIEAQLRSPKPKRRVIRASLRELHGLGQSAVGSGLWMGAWELLQKLFNTI